MAYLQLCLNHQRPFPQRSDLPRQRLQTVSNPRRFQFQFGDLRRQEV